MMRLLFLCLLLLLPAATAVSEDTEGSADDGLTDDEDLSSSAPGPDARGSHGQDSQTGADKDEDQITMIVIIVAVVAVTLSVAAIATIMLVRRNMHNRQQGIYSVPTEQDHKGV